MLAHIINNDRERNDQAGRHMKVQVLQENLQRGLSIVGRAVATRSTLPITANVLLMTDAGRLKLAATDLDISMSAWVGAKIDEPGATTVPSRLISDFVSSLPPGTVNLEIPDRARQLKLECARNESSINAMDAEDFPRLPTFTDGISLKLDPKSLRKAIERVEFAAASDDSRPVLTGVQVKSEGSKVTFASADGFRLAVADVALGVTTESFEVIVPARALRELSRLVNESSEPVEMRINPQKTQVIFAMTDVELVAQLIQGTFPNYANLIPANFNSRAVVNVDEFKREVRIAAIFARDGSGIIRLQFTPGVGMPGTLKISAKAEEVGDNDGEIDTELEVREGDVPKIAFNARYLQDVLNALNGEVALEMTSPSAQGVFRPVGDPDYVHVVMPMFVQW